MVGGFTVVARIPSRSLGGSGFLPGKRCRGLTISVSGAGEDILTRTGLPPRVLGEEEIAEGSFIPSSLHSG